MAMLSEELLPCEKYAGGSSGVLIEQEDFFTDDSLARRWTGHHTLAPTLHSTDLHCTAVPSEEPAQTRNIMLSRALPLLAATSFARQPQICPWSLVLTPYGKSLFKPFFGAQVLLR